MDVFLTILGVIAGIGALRYAQLTYNKTYIEGPKQEKLNLLAQFRITQKLSLQLKEKLITYATLTDSFQKDMFSGVSFEAYLSQMEISYNTNLSDDLYKNLESSDLPQSTIDSMTRSLESQYNALLLLDTEASIKLRGIQENTTL